MKIVKARLIKLKTDDGLYEMNDNIPLGKLYEVDMKSLQFIRAYNIEKKIYHSREMIQDAHTKEWLPREMLLLIE